jgi:hypothetical protein
MKKRFLLLSVIALGLFFRVGITHAQPEFKSDVQKEYDEQGNLKRYDSCWSWSFHDHNFGGFDSLFTGHHFPDFEHFFEEHSFHGFDSLFSGQLYPDFESFFEGRTFPDIDSLMENRPFPDPESFFGDHPFPDFKEFFEGHEFPDYKEFFEGHQFPDFDKLYEHFHNHRFHEDSVPQLKPGWQSFPGNKKNSPRTIEI